MCTPTKMKETETQRKSASKEIIRQGKKNLITFKVEPVFNSQSM